MPEIASVSARLTCLPGQTGEQPREQWAVLLAVPPYLRNLLVTEG